MCFELGFFAFHASAAFSSVSCSLSFMSSWGGLALSKNPHYEPEKREYNIKSFWELGEMPHSKDFQFSVFSKEIRALWILSVQFSKLGGECRVFFTCREIFIAQGRRFGSFLLPCSGSGGMSLFCISVPLIDLAFFPLILQLQGPKLPVCFSACFLEPAEELTAEVYCRLPWDGIQEKERRCLCISLYLWSTQHTEEKQIGHFFQSQNILVIFQRSTNNLRKK